MEVSFFTKVGSCAKVALKKMKHSKPEIALIVGGLSVLAGTVLACTKTKEAVDAIETTKQELRDAKENVEEGTKEAAITYSKIYGCFARKMAKIYGLPAALWIGGMGSIVGAHSDLRHQNADLLLKSTALKQVFDEYRARVAADVGEEREKQLYFGAKEEEIDVIEVNPETGTKKVVRKKGTTFDSNSGSIFARNWSERTSYACDNRTFTEYFLEAKIKELNKRLKLVPFITMNEVYDELEMKPGFGRCKDAMDWGWVWNPNNPDGPNEIIVTRLEGWEEVEDERENKKYYVRCDRLDFNPQPLKPLL